MDRAGLVGPDGPTHHGVFDIPMLRMLPEMVVSAPKDGNELRDLLYTATQNNKSFSIRYPKGSSRNFDLNLKPKKLKIGSWQQLIQGENLAIIATGSMVGMAQDSIEKVSNQIGFKPTLINARFIKPFDEKMLLEISKNHTHIITIEEGCLTGGFGSGILEYLNTNQIEIKIIVWVFQIIM